MASIAYGKQLKLYLEKEEAEALYSTGINNDCPAGFFCPTKKVWWVIENENGNYPYTLCQNCYHNNNFGEQTEDVKDLLQPLFLQSIPCCCDGIKQNDAFPLFLDGNNDFRIGIYQLHPKIVLINGVKNENNNNNNDLVIDISVPEEKIIYVICILCLNVNIDPSDVVNKIKCRTFDKDNNEENSIHTAPMGMQNGEIRVDLMGIFNNETHSVNPFKIQFTETNKEEKRRLQILINEEIIVDFNLIIRHDSFKDNLNINSETTNNDFDDFDKHKTIVVDI